MFRNMIRYAKENPFHMAGAALVFLFSPGKKFLLAKKYLTPVLATYGIGLFKQLVVGKNKGSKQLATSSSR